MSLIEGLAGWQVAGVTVLAVVAVVVGGHYLSRPLFRFIAGAKLREVFTAAALLLVVGIALLMMLVGLSPALGTFLAGVVLANSEFRHELESDIDPFKGLLLGLFFITVGAGINFGYLFEQFGLVIGLTVGLMAIKAAVLFCLALVFKLKGADKWLFTLGLAQAGEFGFVLLSFTVQNGVISGELSQLLLLVVALSMLLTPALFIGYERLLLPKLTQDQEREADEISEQGTVIIAGIGRFGQVVNRMLLGNGYKTVVLDLSTEAVDRVGRFGVKTFFGDASRPDLLHAAGLEEAKMIVVAIDDEERALEIVRHARQVRPDIHIVARAKDRHSVYDMYYAGANDMIRETFDSSVRAGRSALEGLGVHPYEAEKISTAFVQQDLWGIREMAALYNPDIPVLENEPYIAKAKEVRDEMDRAMVGSTKGHKGAIDRAWMPPGRRPEEVEE